MSVLHRTFKPVKSTCQRCVQTTRIPLDWQDLKKGDRDPEPWSEEDEKRWRDGIVLCPQAGGPHKPERKWCLRVNEVDAINSGAISVWEEHDGN